VTASRGCVSCNDAQVRSRMSAAVRRSASWLTTGTESSPVQQITSIDAERLAAKSAANATADAARSEPSVPATTRCRGPATVAAQPSFTTTTGHCAVLATAKEIEPRRVARTEPRPREPTTSRDASADSSTSASVGLVTTVLPIAIRSGYAALTLGDSEIGDLCRRVQRTGFEFEKSGPWGECHPGIVGREENDQRSGAVERLVGRPIKRLAGMLLAVVSDDDGHLAHRTADGSVRQRLGTAPQVRGSRSREHARFREHVRSGEVRAAFAERSTHGGSNIGHSGINDRPRPLRDLGPLTDRSGRRSILSWRRIALRTRCLPERATEGVE
jgi:hypothetical protein